MWISCKVIFLTPPSEATVAEANAHEQPTRAAPHTESQEPSPGGLDQDDSPDEPTEEGGQGDEFAAREQLGFTLTDLAST